MPLQYEGILAEHRQTRAAVSMFDTCHMGRFRVSGPHSVDALARLLTVDVRRMRDGQCRYGFLLREDGGILDDLIVYRIAPELWMAVVNAGTRSRDLDWVRERLGPGASVEDDTARLGKLDVQGPESPRLIGAVLGTPLPPARFTFAPFAWRGTEGIFSATGYTGESGAELYFPAERMGELWDAFLAAGVKPAGLGARDVLRLEAGLPLYGHELSESVTPVHAGMDRFASKDGDFIGRAALLALRSRPPPSRLSGFRTAGRQSARAGNPVLAAGAAAGAVTSGSFSPALGCGIGFAYVAREHAAAGTRIGIDTGRGTLDAELCAAPFYRRTGHKETTT